MTVHYLSCIPSPLPSLSLPTTPSSVSLCPDPCPGQQLSASAIEASEKKHFCIGEVMSLVSISPYFCLGLRHPARSFALIPPCDKECLAAAMEAMGKEQSYPSCVISFFATFPCVSMALACFLCTSSALILAFKQLSAAAMEAMGKKEVLEALHAIAPLAFLQVRVIFLPTLTRHTVLVTRMSYLE